MSLDLEAGAYNPERLTPQALANAMIGHHFLVTASQTGDDHGLRDTTHRDSTSNGSGKHD